MRLDPQTDAPKPTLLADYTPYSHELTRTELTFDIRNEQEVLVTARLSLAPNPAAEPNRELRLHANESVMLLAVKLDGETLPTARYSRDEKGLTLHGIPETPITLEIEVRINPEANTELAGLYTSGGKFCTQCESHGFRNITFFPDRPDVMSEYFTTILADGARYPQMLSNGNLVADETLPDGRRKVVWHDPFRKPSYLFALVAADLAMLEDDFTTASGRAVKLQMFTDQPADGDIQTAQRQLTHAMDSLKRSMAWDERRFGREYDLDLFMVVAVDDFNFGAMENKGLNIFNSKVLLATPETATDGRYGRVESVVAHEYFHNWTGNRITCRDWFQLCLKEGLTVFRDQEFSADTHSRPLQRIADVRFLRASQFAEDASPNAHPIRPDSFMTVENFYTTTIYEKGSEVIRMLHTLLGEPGFRRGTDLYFERHDGQAVTTEDFVACLRDANPASGFDFAQFEQAWYNQAGTPVVKITERYDAAAQRYTLTLSQSCPPVPRETERRREKIPYLMPIKIGLLDEAGKDIALKPEGAQGQILHGDVLVLSQPQQSFVFTDVPCPPALSPLRDFSAPVRLDWQPTREALALRIAQDADGFNRWEAAHALAVQELQAMVTARRQGQATPGMAAGADASLIDALRRMLADDSLAAEMKAEMLALPGHAYLAGLYPDGEVDPLAIHAAREALRAQIATALERELAAAYRTHRTPPGAEYRFTQAEVSRRSMANTALFYLLALPDASAYAPLAVEQQAKAGNFTDEMGAVHALVEHHDAIGGQPTRQRAMDAFYAKWSDDALVVDSWLSYETSIDRADALARTQALMNGPFPRDATNPEKLKPNKVRAILNGFADGNPAQFHRADGAGYAFLAEQVRMLDKANPRLAARLVQPLCDFARYEPNRRAQMLAHLKEIGTLAGLSVDTHEIVSNALKAT